MASANLANAMAVASLDGEPLACSDAFRELLDLTGDGSAGLAALLAKLPILERARAGAGWTGTLDLGGRGPVALSAEPARGCILLSATPGGGAAAVAAARVVAFDRLAQGVVHDARNPLNALAIHLELARARLADLDAASCERVHKHVSAAQEQIGRVEQVLKRFLRFASPQSTSGEVDLAELLQQAVDVCTHEARRHGVRLEARLGVARVHGDLAQLSAAILELVLRSIDATGSGGRLGIALESRGGDAVLLLAEEPGDGGTAACPKPVASPGAADPSLCAAGEIVELHRGLLTARMHGAATEIEVRLPLVAAVAAGT